MNKLKEALERLDAKRAEIGQFLDEAGPELDVTKVAFLGSDGGDTSIDKVNWLRERNAELDELAKEVDDLRHVQKAREDAAKAANLAAEMSEVANAIPQGKAPEPQQKSIGELFVESAAYARKGDEAMLDVDLKTLFQTSAGWAPESIRTGRLVDYASTEVVDILDRIPTVPLNQVNVVYMEETTYTQSAAEVAEAGTFAESAFALTERTSAVKKIAHFIPVTDEQLEDVAQASAYLNNRMVRGLRERLNQQVLVGDGTGANLTGFLNTGSIQTQAKGADPTPDAIHKAMTKVRTTGASMPNLIILNPADWEEIALLRTADGVYIWGPPQSAQPLSIWGLPVAQSQQETSGTGLVLDTFYTQLGMYRGVTVKTSDSHSTYFIEGKQAIRADMRVALTVFRPVALCTVTGI